MSMWTPKFGRLDVHFFEFTAILHLVILHLAFSFYFCTHLNWYFCTSTLHTFMPVLHTLMVDVANTLCRLLDTFLSVLLAIMITLVPFWAAARDKTFNGHLHQGVRLTFSQLGLKSKWHSIKQPGVYALTMTIIDHFVHLFHTLFTKAI